MRSLIICTVLVTLLSTLAGCIWVPGRETHHYYYYPENGYPGPYYYNPRDGRYYAYPPPDGRPAEERRGERTEQR